MYDLIVERISLSCIQQSVAPAIPVCAQIIVDAVVCATHWGIDWVAPAIRLTEKLMHMSVCEELAVFCSAGFAIVCCPGLFCCYMLSKR
jgi:hypothetical protein